MGDRGRWGRVQAQAEPACAGVRPSRIRANDQAIDAARARPHRRHQQRDDEHRAHRESRQSTVVSVVMRVLVRVVLLVMTPVIRRRCGAIIAPVVLPFTGRRRDASDARPRRRLWRRMNARIGAIPSPLGGEIDALDRADFGDCAAAAASIGAAAFSRRAITIRQVHARRHRPKIAARSNGARCPAVDICTQPLTRGACLRPARPARPPRRGARAPCARWRFAQGPPRPACRCGTAARARIR